MSGQCVVPGCGRGGQSGAALYALPSAHAQSELHSGGEEVRVQWLRWLEGQGFDVHGGVMGELQGGGVCQAHFSPSCFSPSSPSDSFPILKPDAVPSLVPTPTPIIELPTQQIPFVAAAEPEPMQEDKAPFVEEKPEELEEEEEEQQPLGVRKVRFKIKQSPYTTLDQPDLAQDLCLMSTEENSTKVFTSKLHFAAFSRLRKTLRQEDDEIAHLSVPISVAHLEKFSRFITTGTLPEHPDEALEESFKVLGFNLSNLTFSSDGPVQNFLSNDLCTREEFFEPIVKPKPVSSKPRHLKRKPDDEENFEYNMEPEFVVESDENEEDEDYDPFLEPKQEMVEYEGHKVEPFSDEDEEEEEEDYTSESDGDYKPAIKRENIKRERSSKSIKRRRSKPSQYGSHSKRGKQDFFWNDYPDIGSVESQKYADKQYKCDDCGFGCDSPRAMIMAQHNLHHIDKGLDRTKVYCIKCRDTFPNVATLRDHVKSEHDGIGLVCHFCPREFLLKSFATYMNHLDEVHLKKRKRTRSYANNHLTKEEWTAQCVHCGMKQRNQSYIVNHIRRWGPFHNNACVQCGQVVNTFEEHEQHVRDFHQGRWVYRCGKCTDDFENEKERDSHRRTAHPSGKAPVTKVFCDSCGGFFHHLPTHLKRCHGSGNGLVPSLPPPGAKGPATCSICHMTFDTPRGLNKHHGLVHGKGMKIREKENELSPCDICGMLFSSVSRHKAQKHNIIREFTCKHCGKASPTEAARKYHEKIHTHPFGCTFVRNHRFKTAEQLLMHQEFCKEKESHKATCAECGRVCSSKDKLKSHMIAMHTPDHEKPFPCRHCPKGFAMEHRRSEHENTHTKTFPFKCRFCDKRFNANSSKSHHENSEHPGEKIMLGEGVGKKGRRRVAAVEEEEIKAPELHQAMNTT